MLVFRLMLRAHLACGVFSFFMETGNIWLFTQNSTTPFCPKLLELSPKAYFLSSILILSSRLWIAEVVLSLQRIGYRMAYPWFEYR